MRNCSRSGGVSRLQALQLTFPHDTFVHLVHAFYPILKLAAQTICRLGTPDHRRGWLLRARAVTDGYCEPWLLWIVVAIGRNERVEFASISDEPSVSSTE